MKLRPAILLCAPLLAAGSLSAQTKITLQPTADTYVRDNDPATNNGTSQDLWIGRGVYWNLGNVRTFLQFDLSGLPSGMGRIRSAYLRIYQYATEPAAGGLENNLHNCEAAWTETGLTWNNQPTYNSIRWGSATPGDSFYTGWLEWYATDIVQLHASGIIPNYGWMLRNRVETAGASRLGYFHSREYVADPSLRPKLDIEIHDLELKATSPITAGAPLDLLATGADPSALVFFVYSRTGPGITPVPKLGVELDVLNPILIGTDRANASGRALLQRTVPANAAGLAVWLQAAQTGKTSNVIQETIV